MIGLRTLALEMIVVGIGLVLVSIFITLIESAVKRESQFQQIGPMISGVFVSGAVFHLICELTGLNKWYVARYPLD